MEKEEEIVYKLFEDLNNEVLKIKEELHHMKYKPHEWFKRDPVFFRTFMNEINKKIAEEVRQGLMFHVYRENPKKVVELVKSVVEDYLKKWELDDQIAEQIVANVISKPEFMNKILSIVIRNVNGFIQKKLLRLSAVADEVLCDLEVIENVLEEKTRNND